MSKMDALMSAPPTSVVGLSLLGASLEDWVYIVTLTWLAIQIGWFLYKRVMQWNNKTWRGAIRDDEDA